MSGMDPLSACGDGSPVEASVPPGQWGGRGGVDEDGEGESACVREKESERGRGRVRYRL